MDNRAPASPPRLTRRDFGRGTLGAVAVAAGVLGPRGRSAAAQETPKKGGKITAAWDSTSAKDTLDPAKTLTQLDVARATFMYNHLIEVAPDGRLRPALAESWESNAAGDQWVLKLRKDVEFHNGKTLAAQDVVYTLRRVLDPKSGSPARVMIADIDALTADDARTVRLKLTAPNADMARLLSLYQLQVVPDGTTDFSRPAGTGPFSCKAFQPGIKAVFVRNPNYWKGGGLPYLDEIETIAIPDPTSRFNALLAGDIQAMTKLDASLLKLAGGYKSIEVFSTPGPAHIALPMRSDAPPFDSNDVRLAMKYAVDRKKLLELVYAGQGVVGYDHPVPSFDPFHCNDIPLKPYDPERVKYHLRKAGHENTQFELFTSTVIPNGVQAATVYAEMATKAGVRIRITQAPADGYWTATYMKKPWFMSDWFGRPTTGATLSVAYASDAKWNEGAWKNAKFDQILRDARSITDTARRKQLYAEAQHILADEGPSVIPIFPNWLDAKSPKMKGIVPHPMGSLGWFFWDGVWLDA